MSKTVARQRKRKAGKLSWKGGRKPLVVICSLLILTLAVGIMAQWKALPGLSKPLALAPTSQGSFNANSPSKEYIYAGGRLVATEEPTGTSASPTPTPQSGSTENLIWTNFVGSAATGNTLAKTAGSNGWDAGASSTRAIASGDGYVEFSVSLATDHKICGLNNGDSDTSYSEIDYAIYPNYLSQVYIYEGGNQIGQFGTYTTSDTFRIAISGGKVQYLKNGQLLYEHTTTPTYPLRADTSLYSPNSQITNAVISGNLTSVLPTENVSWKNVTNSSASGNSLTKTAGTTGWDAGASSTRAIASGDGYVEFSVNLTSDHKMAGLSNGDTNTAISDIDFAIYPNDAGQIYIYESGTQIGNSYGSYTTGDHFRVAVSGDKVQYLKNGQLLYEHQATFTYPLLVDTSLYTTGSQISNAVISGNLMNLLPVEQVTWASVTNATASGNSLSKPSSGTNGWDAGAVSTKSISSGDGYVEFTVGAATDHKMCGLSNGNTNTNFTDIDFAIYPNYLGQVYIYEGGSQIGQFGTYATGDTFRVSVEGGTVKYWKKASGQAGWTLLYTSGTTPTYPLLVDTSIYSPGGAINDAIISGTLTP
jgi:hypothetical protein